MARLQPVEYEFDPDKPWGDLPERGKDAKTLEVLIKLHPCVIALDSPWGTGKTTFLRMWEHSLADSYTVVSYNAWERDFASNALDALLGELTEVVNEQDSGAKKHLDGMVKAAGAIGKNALPLVTKALLTKLGVDGAIGDIIADSSARTVDEFLANHKVEKGAVTELRKSLNKIAEKLEDDGKPLLFMIDELDRCRPDFAVQTLEVIKHFFEVSRARFVVALHADELQYSVMQVYGQGFDAEGYLQRFFSYPYSLKAPDIEQFTLSTLKRLTYRASTETDSIERQMLQFGVPQSFKAFELSLRDVQRLLARFAVTKAFLNPNIYRHHSNLVLTLVALRIKDPKSFRSLQLGENDLFHVTKPFLEKSEVNSHWVSELLNKIGFVVGDSCQPEIEKLFEELNAREQHGMVFKPNSQFFQPEGHPEVQAEILSAIEAVGHFDSRQILDEK